MCCLCFDLHRYQFHLISYGVVAFCLVSTGLVFSIFAIFQKDSELGKVWLAGPTAMVIGLVVIDWEAAMESGRANSVDTLLEQAGDTDPRCASTLAMPKTQLVFPQNNVFIGTDENVMENHFPFPPPAEKASSSYKPEEEDEEVPQECHNIHYAAVQCPPFGFTGNDPIDAYYVPISSIQPRTAMPTSFTEPLFAASECECGHIMANRFRTADHNVDANDQAHAVNGSTFQGEKMIIDSTSYFI